VYVDLHFLFFLFVEWCDESAQQAERARDPAYGRPIADRRDADCHQSSVPRRIRLADRSMRNCQSPQLLLDRDEVSLIASRQRHGDRGWW
jgi:hypothetical protein